MLQYNSVQESVRTQEAATEEGRKGSLCMTVAVQLEFIGLKHDTEIQRYSNRNQVILYTRQERDNF